MKIIMLLLVLLSVKLHAQTPFSFEELSVAPGEKRSIQLQVKTNEGISTFIPVTIVNGAKDGPVLGLIAGIHGFEYPPIVAMQAFREQVDPKLLAGTIIIVQVANVSAFFARTVYYSPSDGKNLNRQFPGNKNGTLTEVLAWTITHKILKRCNYLVDIHAGDASEDLHDYISYYDNVAGSSTSKKMAEAMNFEWIIMNALNPQTQQPSVYLTSEAARQNIPVIAIECGKLGVVREGETNKINGGLQNLMRSIGMMEGVVHPNTSFIEITKRLSIESQHTGIFKSRFKSGDMIRKGAKLAEITDLFGNVIDEILAPADGFIIYMLSTPPVNKGEILFSLSVLNS